MQPKPSATLNQAALQHIVHLFGPNHSDGEGKKRSSADVSSMFQAFADMPYSADI